MPTTQVFVSQKQLSTLWGVKQPQVSKICAEHGLRDHRDVGIDLEAALEARQPRWLMQANFEQCIAHATAFRDGARVEPVQATRDLGLYGLYMPAKPAKPARADAKRPPAPSTAAPVLLDRVDRADALAAARLDKLRAEIEGRELRTKREAGELLDRKTVMQELSAAAAIVQSTFALLPARLAAPLPVEFRAEAMQATEDMLERALHAIISALGGADAG